MIAQCSRFDRAVNTRVDIRPTACILTEDMAPKAVCTTEYKKKTWIEDHFQVDESQIRDCTSDCMWFPVPLGIASLTGAFQIYLK